MGVRSTTIWEQWGAPVLSGGMDSRNHPMFAGPADTMYTRFAGCLRKRNIRRFCLDDATLLVLPRQAQDGQRGDPYVQSTLQRRGCGAFENRLRQAPGTFGFEHVVFAPPGQIISMAKANLMLNKARSILRENNGSFVAF